jgi:hypothetical protein
MNKLAMCVGVMMSVAMASPAWTQQTRPSG